MGIALDSMRFTFNHCRSGGRAFVRSSCTVCLILPATTCSDCQASNVNERGPRIWRSEVIWRVGVLSQCREQARRVYHGAVFEINMVE